MRPILYGQVIQQLRDEGLPITPSKINYAIYNGRLGPIPLDAAGNRQFTPKHLEQLRNYLLDPPRRGRKPHGEAAPCK